MYYLMIEVNQTDARYRQTEICQSLEARMGTGGGNVPLVVEIDDNSDRKAIRRVSQGRQSGKPEKS